MLTAEDFETYSDGKAEATTSKPSFNDSWGFFPPTDAWELYTQQTRQLWVGRRVDNNSSDPYTGDVYAWNVGSRMPGQRAIDKEMTVIARFRARQVTDERGEWGFGVLTNFTRDQRQSSGYRFAVRVETTDSGWNTSSRAQLEKIYCPSSPTNETSFVANDSDGDDKILPVRELDDPGREISSVITPGVWYWMKMRMSRSQKVVSLAGKVWVEGSPEPAEWTVGPVHDRWEDSDALLTILDDFGPGGDPIAGGFCGVWSYGAEIAVDDFSVDWRKTWLLPKGIFMQAKTPGSGAGADDDQLVALDRYEAGSFPITYRPDGTAASDKSVLVVITNISSGDRRAVIIDRNTGRVQAADDLSAIK
jgi:hypothetical protein